MLLKADLYAQERTSSLPQQRCFHNNFQKLVLPERAWRKLTPHRKLRVQAADASKPYSWRQQLAKKPAAKASLLTGSYITVVGCALAIAPFKTFGILFDISTVARGWIQVGGILAILFGIYYLGAGIGDCLDTGTKGFYVSTILGRIVLSLAFAWLAGAKAVPQGILVLAAVNLVGAAGMARALILPRPGA